MWHFASLAQQNLAVTDLVPKFIEGRASQAGDPDSFWSSGLTSGFMNVHCGTLLFVPQLRFISSFVLYVRPGQVLVLVELASYCA